MRHVRTGGIYPENCIKGSAAGIYRERGIPFIGIYGKGRETARLNEIPDARHIVLSIDSLVILPHV